MRSAKEYKAIREEIYRFIGAYITKHVYAPSNKEIAEAVGISGTTVHRHIIDMIDEGILETDAEPGTQRAIRIRNTQVVKRRKKSECNRGREQRHDHQCKCNDGPEQRETDKRHHEYHIIAGSVTAIPGQELKHRMGYRRRSGETGKRYG